MILPNLKPHATSEFKLLNYNKDIFEYPSLILDSNKKVLAYNYQFLNLFNLLENEVRCISIYHLLNNILNFNQLIEKIYRDPFKSENFNSLHKFKNGKQINLNISISKVVNQHMASELIILKFNQI